MRLDCAFKLGQAPIVGLSSEHCCRLYLLNQPQPKHRQLSSSMDSSSASKCFHEHNSWIASFLETKSKSKSRRQPRTSRIVVFCSISGRVLSKSIFIVLNGMVLDNPLAQQMREHKLSSLTTDPRRSMICVALKWRRMLSTSRAVQTSPIDALFAISKCSVLSGGNECLRCVQQPHTSTYPEPVNLQEQAQVETSCLPT